MNFNFRRYLYIFFIIVFLIAAPSLMLYSLGYNLEPGLKLQKTGMMVVETEPKAATVYLNDKIQQKFWSSLLNREKSVIKTPAKIKYLTPGEYDVSVEIEGYWPWSKRLLVESGKTTFATDIYLFRNDDPIFIKNIDNEIFSFSPSNKYFFSLNTLGAELINLENQKTDFLPLESPQAINNSELSPVRWSSGEKKVLVSSNLFFTDNWKTKSDVDILIGSNPLNYQWAENSDNEIYYTLENKLFSFNLDSSSNKEIMNADGFVNFYSKSGNLFIVESVGEKTSLLMKDKSESKTKKILELPFSSYEFVNTEHDLLNLYDTTNKTLYLIDPYSSIRPLSEVIRGTDIYRWVSKTKLLYSTGFEIWLFDLNTLEKMLITRISENIKGLIWHPSNRNIIFSTRSNIFILELDKREKYSITKIATFDNILEIAMSIKGRIIYAVCQEADKKSLYKIFIR
jgi:hypothetical protein